MAKDTVRYHPKREEWLAKMEEEMAQGIWPTNQDLIRLLAVNNFDEVWRQLRGKFSGILAAKAIERAQQGSDKALMFLLQASSPEIFDGAVRAAKVTNEGNWLNTLLQSKIDVALANRADPLADAIEVSEIPPAISYKENEGSE